MFKRLLEAAKLFTQAPERAVTGLDNYQIPSEIAYEQESGRARIIFFGLSLVAYVSYIIFAGEQGMPLLSFIAYYSTVILIGIMVLIGENIIVTKLSSKITEQFDVISPSIDSILKIIDRDTLHKIEKTRVDFEAEEEEHCKNREQISKQSWLEAIQEAINMVNYSLEILAISLLALFTRDYWREFKDNISLIKITPIAYLVLVLGIIVFSNNILSLMFGMLFVVVSVLVNTALLVSHSYLKSLMLERFDSLSEYTGMSINMRNALINRLADEKIDAFDSSDATNQQATETPQEESPDVRTD